MRGLIGLCVATLAACDDAVAIEVVVPEGMAADEVDLFIPLDPCKIEVAEGMFAECDSLLGDNGIKLGAEDEIFALDTMLFQRATGPGSYEFRLEPGERDFIPLLIAVGKADGAPTGAVVFAGFNLDDGPQRRRAELGPASDFGATNFTGPPEGVHVWFADRDDGGRSNCVEVLTQPMIAIVDKKDPDCDGFIDRETTGIGVECDPLAHNANISLDNGFTCTVPAADPDQVCLLGGGSCVDGAGRDACVASSVCVASEICGCEPGDIESCFNSFRVSAMPAIDTAHLRCLIHGQTDIGGGGDVPFQPCIGNSKGFVDVDLGDSLFAGSRCGEIRFAPFDAPESINVFGFGSSMKIAVPDAQVLLDLKVGGKVDPCNFSFEWDAIDVPVSEGAHFTSTAVFDVLDVGVSRQLLLPVEIETTSCANGARGVCVLAGTSVTSRESLLRCAK